MTARKAKTTAAPAPAPALSVSHCTVTMADTRSDAAIEVAKALGEVARSLAVLAEGLKTPSNNTGMRFEMPER